MSKTIRLIIAGLLLLGILLLAGNQIATAGNLLWQNTTVVQGQSASAAFDPANKPGTVKPPPVVVPPINAPGNYSVGGVCTLLVKQLASDVDLHANLLPFNVLKSKPTNDTRYLAGVCNLDYHLSGKPLAELTSEEGTVQICFAQVPNSTSKIYVFDGETWTALDTTLNNGLECALAAKTGKYVLVTQP